MPRPVFAICIAIAFTQLGVNAVRAAEDQTQTLQSFLAEARDAQSRKDFRAAAESYRKAVQLDASIPELWTNLGLMYHESGKSPEAIQSFQQAIRLNASLFVPQLFLGIEYLESKHPDMAIPCLENAARLNPRDVQAALSLGKAYAMQGRGERAAESYLRATALAPNDGNAWLALGTAYLQQVEEDARVMTSNYASSAYVKLRAAEVLSEQGKLVQAEDAFKKSIASPAAAPCSHAEFGILLLRQEKVAEAREQFELENRTGAHCPLTAHGLADQYANCSETLKPALPTSGSGPSQMLASCSFFAGEFQTTSMAARRLKTNPGSRVQGLYWESKADQALAIAALTRASEIDADSPRMHVLIGDVFRQKRQWDNAEAQYRKAVSLDPKSRIARLSLAIVLFSQLKTDEAFEVDRSLLSEDANDPEANLLAGEILVQRNQFAEAEPYLLKCTHLKPEFMARLHSLLGQVYAETNRIPAAIDEYNSGLSTDEDGSVHYQLGRLYQKQGDRNAAQQAFAESQRLRREWDARAHIAIEQGPTDISRK